jgi:GSH-dependent disulfide-bond oxidoreductase
MLGEHTGVSMIKFFYRPSPNPGKVALFLEGAGLPYELVPVDTRKGEHHAAEYKANDQKQDSPLVA